VARMKELSAQYPRYGYRHIRIFLNRDGHRMSPGSGAPAVANGKAASGRGSASPLPRCPARKHRVGRTRCGAYDFVLDHCANGQQLKCLTVADEFTKEGLAIDVDGRSARVIEVLSRLVSARGAPRCLRSDNGPERVQAVVFEEKEVPYNVRYMDKP
jgi:putative transposase